MAKAVRLPAPTIIPIRVDDAISAYLAHLEIKRRAKDTIKAYKSNLARLPAAAGGGRTHLHTLTPAHVDQYMAAFSNSRGGGRDNALTRLRTFWKWAALNKHVSPFPYDDPTQGHERKNGAPAKRGPFPASRWPELLDAAEAKHPIHRMSVAMGLYLMARGPSEIRVLRLEEFDFTNWTVGITRTKTDSPKDPIKICGELRIEITKYLTWYNEWSRLRLGMELQPHWYLIPTSNRQGPDPMKRRINPEVPASKNTISNMAEAALNACGFETRDENGHKNGRGASHALRAIGARALYDELIDRGYDGALSVVREMLGHSTIRTTETYLGLHLDKARRDKAVVQNSGFMFAHNDPSQSKPVDLNTARLPASLTGAVVLGGASRVRLDAAERAVEALPAFLRAA